MTHAAAWLTWVGAVLVILSTTRNPWYVGLVLACLAAVHAAVRSTVTGTAPIPLSITRFGLIVVAFSALFNALTVHFGRTILFSLPEIIPFFGGPVTLEALVYGAINGLVLTGLFAAFTIFNRAVSIQQMIRLVPRAFFPVAIITSVAVTFVPITLRHYRAIREAQAVRGHRLRGVRDWLPLVMPLLIGGLERALQLAEAMTARGFASAETASHTVQTRLAVLLGLLLLLVGWLLRLVWGLSGVGLLLLLGGVILIGATVWRIGQQTPRTVYRPQPWTSRDWLVVACAGATVAAFLLPLPGLERASIFYYPYPSLLLPEFNTLLGAAIAGLLGPVLPILRAIRPASSSSPEGVMG